jgi:hypothetical protein
LCEDYPCRKFDGVDLFDSFITHKNQFQDLNKAKRNGIDSYKAELDEKVRLLDELLKSYDDGRRKSFYCVAVNLLDLQDIRAVMRQINGGIEPEMPLKIKTVVVVRLFDEMADKRAVSLQLRKKSNQK